jgi:2-haloalkanoic acid dehalogenase type II
MTLPPIVASRTRVDGLLVDLLMAVMNSLEVWRRAAGDGQRGLEWRDRVTARMTALGTYEPYEELVRHAAGEMRLPAAASRNLFERWAEMDPWPDAAAIAATTVPYGFVTNCSTELALIAAHRSGLRPQFVLSAEEAGWFKPSEQIYLAACRRLGTAPERTAFVAGSPYDAAGARTAGLLTRLVIRRADQRPKQPSDRAATSLPEILSEIDKAYSGR